MRQMQLHLVLKYMLQRKGAIVLNSSLPIKGGGGLRSLVQECSLGSEKTLFFYVCDTSHLFLPSI